MSVKQRVEEELGIGEKTPIKMTIDGHSVYPSVNIEIIDAEALLSLIEAAEEISVASPAEFEHESLEYDIRQVDKDAWRELLAALKAVTDD